LAAVAAVVVLQERVNLWVAVAVALAVMLIQQQDQYLQVL
jgi:hypothetical protein